MKLITSLMTTGASTAIFKVLFEAGYRGKAFVAAVIMGIMVQYAIEKGYKMISR